MRRRGECIMRKRFRVVRLRNGDFAIEEKRFFFWTLLLERCGDGDSYSVVSFDTKEDAIYYVETLRQSWCDVVEVFDEVKPKSRKEEADTPDETEAEERFKILPVWAGVEEIAKVAHQANKALCEANGDYSQTSWEYAPEWQKESAIDSILAIFNTPKTTPEDLHEIWMKKKIEEGWVYGEEKDTEKRTHPCIVPYDKLDPFQRAKDKVFVQIVKAIRETAVANY